MQLCSHYRPKQYKFDGVGLAVACVLLWLFSLLMCPFYERLFSCTLLLFHRALALTGKETHSSRVLFTSWIECYACPLLHFSTQRRCHLHCSAVSSFFHFAVPANRFAYLLVTIVREDVLLFCAVYAFPPSVLQRCILQASPYSPLSPQLVATIPSVLSSSCIFFSSGEQLPSKHKSHARWLPESVVVQIFMTLMRLSR